MPVLQLTICSINEIDVQRQLLGREPVHQSLYLWSKTVLSNYILRMFAEGVEMAHPIEGRLPFLDRKVVEFVRNMPVSLKIRGQTEKYVLREAAKPFIIIDRDLAVVRSNLKFFRGYLGNLNFQI